MRMRNVFADGNSNQRNCQPVYRCSRPTSAYDRRFLANRLGTVLQYGGYVDCDGGKGPHQMQSILATAGRYAGFGAELSTVGEMHERHGDLHMHAKGIFAEK